MLHVYIAIGNIADHSNTSRAANQPVIRYAREEPVVDIQEAELQWDWRVIDTVKRYGPPAE
jgi:hypothetical protein